MKRSFMTPIQTMTIEGTNVTVTFPEQEPTLLAEGTIVRFYFNDEQQQLVAYLGRGLVTLAGTSRIFNVTLGLCDNVPEPCGAIPSNDYPVVMEIATDGVGEYWTTVVPTSTENQVGIIWAPATEFVCASLQV